MAKSLPSLHIPFSPIRASSLLEHAASSSLPPDLNSFLLTCGDLIEGVEVSMEQLQSSANRELKWLRTQHQVSPKASGSWRKQENYSSRRDDIKVTLRGLGREESGKELNVLRQVLGLPGGRGAVRLQDLGSVSMKKLLNLNQRRFGESQYPTEIRLPDPPRSLHRRKKKSPIFSSFSHTPLQKQQLFHSSLPLQAIKRLSLYQRLTAVYSDPGTVSPLNQFIFKHAQKYQRKAL